MKITDLSILCEWENLKNRLCIKYLFAPLYMFNIIGCVIEQASAYWHKVTLLFRCFFFNNIAAS